jgi:hypothetical protein
MEHAAYLKEIVNAYQFEVWGEATFSSLAEHATSEDEIEVTSWVIPGLSLGARSLGVVCTSKGDKGPVAGTSRSLPSHAMPLADGHPALVRPTSRYCARSAARGSRVTLRERQPERLMFWFCERKLVGSNVFLSAVSRA